MGREYRLRAILAAPRPGNPAPVGRPRSGRHGTGASVPPADRLRRPAADLQQGARLRRHPTGTSPRRLGSIDAGHCPAVDTSTACCRVRAASDVCHNHAGHGRRMVRYEAGIVDQLGRAPFPRGGLIPTPHRPCAIPASIPPDPSPLARRLWRLDRTCVRNGR